MEEATRSDQKKRKASWSYLPQSLLELILKRLTLPDYLRFGCVCRAAFVACGAQPKQNVFILALPQLPFLLLPTSLHEGRMEFLDLSIEYTSHQSSQIS